MKQSVMCSIEVAWDDLLLGEVSAGSDIIKGAAASGVPALACGLCSTPHLQELHDTMA